MTPDQSFAISMVVCVLVTIVCCHTLEGRRRVVLAEHLRSVQSYLGERMFAGAAVAAPILAGVPAVYFTVGDDPRHAVLLAAVFAVQLVINCRYWAALGVRLREARAAGETPSAERIP